jgi:predicted amidophosphoribosyltransferase
MLSGTIVPVPPVLPKPPGRRSGPTDELAAALAERIDAPLERCLERSLGDPAGEGGTSRIARPPRIRTTTAAPRNVLLIDVVLDAGTTLTACARRLRVGGASRVVAVTFARH